jgi:hypothetical protein
MITLKEFMEAIQYQITDGSKYQWNCYGPDAYSLEFWNGELDSSGASASVVFDTKTQFVYQVEAWDYGRAHEYRWIHPGYIESHAAEAISRGVDYQQSFDDSKFTDIELPEDIMEKLTAIVAGEDYDERIVVQLDLDDDNRILLMEMAHEADLSLNQYVEHILREEMLRHGVEV